MSANPAQDWLTANQRSLSAELARVRGLLARHLGEEGVAGGEPPGIGAGPSMLDNLCRVFGLSAFERDLLLLCAGVELDARFAALCARAGEPSFGLALTLLPDPHWSALTPEAPLRHWRLLDLEPGAGLTSARLRIAERVLHHLTGLHGQDEELAGRVTPVAADGLPLAPGQRRVAERLAAAWEDPEPSAPVLQLHGPDPALRRAVAAAAAARLGLRLHALPTGLLPAEPGELARLQRLWTREAVLGSAALLLEHDAGEASGRTVLTRFLDGIGGLLLVSAREPLDLAPRESLGFALERPPAAERRALWTVALGEQAERLDGQLGRLSAQFDLGPGAIRLACRQALAEGGENLADRLWQACREQARPRLGELAQPIEALAEWEDLVLPPRQKSILAEIALQVRQRERVYGDWGFARKSARGLGISALFSGPSGTGKTLAAEVLARTLRLDLYRIDLSQVVSKYIGETEKNLARVFDAAEGGGAILLFDEADALFGRRSEVRDSHDRYANIEVSYLLQRMEAFRGLAILTTNLKQAIDDAFLRRIRFVVQFPFPDASARAAIWQRMFPPQTPLEGVEWTCLARLNVAGGNIRNIALHAAFAAADADQPVTMGHLLGAARSEYAKLEKPLTDSEIGGWT